MTDFATRETAQYTGRPVECFRFAQGSSLWLYTSADRQIILPAGTFLPEPITRGEFDYSSEDHSGSVEVKVSRTNPVAALFIPSPPASPVGVSMFRAHRGDEAAAKCRFQGRVMSSKNEDDGSQSTLICSPISKLLARTVPATVFQQQCNRVLYSTECGVDPNDFRTPVTVTTVTGRNIVSNDLLGFGDGWFEGGFVRRADQDARFIVSHVGNTITLMSAFVGLESLEVVDVYAGCNRLDCTCAKNDEGNPDGKFDNLVNHAGFSRMPLRNPHVGRIA